MPVQRPARRAFPQARREEAGHVLALALIILAVGSLLVTSLLTSGTTTLLGSGQARERLEQQTAADAGVEHAIWRVRYDAGFLSSLVASTPVTYARTVGNVPVSISVTLVPTPTPAPTPTPIGTPQSGGSIQVAKTGSPTTALPYQTTVFTFTIAVTNTGTSTVHFSEIYDLLPAGFTYVAGSSSGITAAEPVLSMQSGRQKVDWLFGSPYPGVPSESTLYQVFRAVATLEDGAYYNQAFVQAVPGSIGLVGGSSATVVANMEQYDIRATAGPLSIRSRIGLQDGAVHIRSWQEE